MHFQFYNVCLEFYSHVESKCCISPILVAHLCSFVVCKMLIGTDMCILDAILTVHFEQKIVKYNNGSAQVAVSNIY